MVKKKKTETATAEIVEEPVETVTASAKPYKKTVRLDDLTQREFESIIGSYLDEEESLEAWKAFNSKQTVTLTLKK